MMMRMGTTETAGNHWETASDIAFNETEGEAFRLAVLQAIADRLALIDKQLIHIDAQVHELTRFVDEHKPALARAMALLHPGAGILKYMGGKNRSTDG